MTSRIGVASNQYQGKYKKVLCVCSGGILRSPTTALVLSQEPYNFNTRACGTKHYALVALDKILLMWADEIVVMEEEHSVEVLEAAKPLGTLFNAPIKVLDIADTFAYRDSKLIELIKEKYTL